MAEKNIENYDTQLSIQGTVLRDEASILLYTAFSLRYRWYITILLGYLCLVSSLMANIYFPLIQRLAVQYRTSIQSINLTITLYLVMQGIPPSIFAPLSDTLGRRPVYLMSFGLYTAASLGLAFSGYSYVALLLLRALQSIGGSATLSLAYAVVADYTVHSERGRFLSPMMTATNIGPSIGPIISGGTILATGMTCRVCAFGQPILENRLCLGRPHSSRGIHKRRSRYLVCFQNCPMQLA